MIAVKKFIPGIACFFLVLILICLPGSNLPKGDDWMSAIFFDKWVHAGLFAILAFLFMMPVCKSKLPTKKKWFVVCIMALCFIIWGLTTEFIQKYFIAGRAFDLWDWAADSMGVLLAIFACRKFYLK